MSDHPLCPWCGAASPRYCDLREEMDRCPWEESEETDTPAGRALLASLPEEGGR